jgi:CheY-like chemotaxis protein
VARTLLLADDSVTIQRVIELTFADEDIRVVAVGDGDQAIAALDRNPPDIVLADVGMPGRDGYEVAEHIRRTPALSHIPVLLLTGAFEPVDQARALQVGCDGVLAKPFEPQQVIGRVKELLSKPKSAAAPFAAPAPEPPDERLPHAPADPIGTPEDADQYFERLDRAFANLASGHAGEPPPGPPAPPKPPAAEVDWFSTTAPVPVSAAQAPPPPLVDRVDAPVPVPAYETPVLASPPPSGSAPAEAPPAPLQLADAFAALLAAEQSLPAPSPAPWGAPATTPARDDRRDRAARARTDVRSGRP